MTDLTSDVDDRLAYVDARDRDLRAGMDYTPPERTNAVKAAARHTARVRLLKRAIVLGAILGPSTIAIIAIFNPFRNLPAITVSGVGVHGTKITMDNPKLSGVQQGGGPYQIVAKSGIQDITKPSVIELIGVDANVGMADKTSTHILSQHGLYDSKADTMVLSGDVKIANTSGYTFHMQSATMNFQAGLLVSHERLRVDLKGGVVNSDDLAISNNGHVIAFRGHIDSTFDAPDEAPAPAASAQASR
ncbi:hypothetical protein RHAL1_00992 [Beijerinckiaceae bacterium RH AL1]|nr:LPS export ABC transporter periplasmic protein LptC [Beijerinckiaceae bacterium]VVB43957.1 hypothetical protein RHCH11_RHCH11_00967 [Beijerinckiaceae bacterium RH CH11]VVB43984.1 hypothetical protein RHAL8_00964 [Beijerinckiaceae bacterium RH AL8]VVC54099.1 hypothetical protein RHAL1_00992 [Beijerinckiaceae bacterium RH AL1]